MKKKIAVLIFVFLSTKVFAQFESSITILDSNDLIYFKIYNYESRSKFTSRTGLSINLKNHLIPTRSSSNCWVVEIREGNPGRSLLVIFDSLRSEVLINNVITYSCKYNSVAYYDLLNDKIIIASFDLIEKAEFEIQDLCEAFSSYLCINFDKSCFMSVNCLKLFFDLDSEKLLQW